MSSTEADYGPKKDFFVSYNKADGAWAEWIAWHLEEAGYSVVIQAWDFRPGGNFVLDMQSAVLGTERTIAVLSPDYLTSIYTAPEWAEVFGRDPTGKNGLLLPIRVRECEPPGLLAPIVYIDLVKLDEATASKTLLAGLKRDRNDAKPPTRPDFPGAPPRAVIERPRFPGTLPSVWNIQHNRNPNFTGRDDLLTDLRELLISGKTAALTHGMGGVGKTQLALEYAYRHMSDYSIVWWLHSEQPTTLADDYAALAPRLGLDLPQNTPPDATREAVRQALAQRKDWLLIFDNAVQPQDIAPYLPQGGYRHIIITSRNPNWRGTAQPLPVTTWERKDSIAFLLKGQGNNDNAAAKALADLLGDLPLALAQAVAYCEETGISLSAYAALYHKYQTEMLQSGAPSNDYQDTIATTWDISFNAIQSTPLAPDLLNLCAFLAPDDIPRDLFEHWAKCSSPIPLNKAIAALRTYSLIEATDTAISVHRLVQAVTRDRMADAARNASAEEALNLVNNAFPNDVWNNVAGWETCARLLPHSLAAATHAEALAIALQSAARLLNEIGSYLNVRAEYAEAKKTFERAVVIGEAKYGLNHPKVAIRVNNLGNVLRDLGDYAGAKECFEKAIVIDEAAFGPNHPNVASRANNLGIVFKHLGDLKGAKECLERAIVIGEAAFGPDHPHVATAINNLGDVLRDLGDLARAKECFDRAIVIGEAAYGPNHPQVAIYINNLGSVLKDLGDFVGAKECFERAIVIDETTFGPNHPNVAIRVNNLGMVLEDLGDLTGAKECYERAVAVFLQFLGAEHPNTKVVQENLEIVLAEMREKGLS